MAEERLYLHCRQCAAEKPGNISPKDYAKLEVSVVRKGDKNIIYIDCTRHGKNVGAFTLEKLLFAKTTCEHCGNDIEDKEPKKVIH
jgi:hypothetical protein